MILLKGTPLTMLISHWQPEVEFGYKLWLSMNVTNYICSQKQLTTLLKLSNTLISKSHSASWYPQSHARCPGMRLCLKGMLT